MVVSEKLAWTNDEVRLYAEIDIDIELTSENSNDEAKGKVAILQGVSPEWIDPIRFGIGLFLEVYASRFPLVCKSWVIVTHLGTMPPDTTSCAVAYVAFRAMCSAWNVQSDEIFTFDQSTGSFSMSPSFVAIPASK